MSLRTAMMSSCQRIIDVVASSLGIILSLPVLLIAAIAIKLDSRGPVLQSQKHIGKKDTPFVLYRFRSMRADAESMTGPQWAAREDPRVTRVGRIIRRLRIDELPQLINILKGDMSFAGPKPERPYSAMAREEPESPAVACPAPPMDRLPVDKAKQEVPRTVGGMPSRPPEKVEFAVFVPAGVRPNGAFVLDIWIYLREQYAAVKDMAQDVGMKVLGRKAGVSVIRGAKLGITIDIAGLGVRKLMDTIEWDGEATNTSFTINVSAETKVGMYPGTALIRYQSMTIAKIAFVISISYYDHAENLDRTDKLMYVRTAFASYASKDREEVFHRIQGMKSLVPAVDIFLDQLSLHSGQNWQAKLEEHVPTKDIFYLFWSEAAAHSEWVEKEWRMALARRGLEYINPVPLEEPDRVPPPKELAALHFSDPLLRDIAYERLKRQIRDKG